MEITELDENELGLIVKQGRERPDLDYKQGGNWRSMSNDDKCELVRDMIAMANSDVPGYIIYGVTDAGGVAGSWDGMSVVDTDSFDPADIRNKAKEYADPEIKFAVYKPTVDRKQYVLIRISPFSSVPVICRRSSGSVLQEATIYVRSEGAQTMKVPSAEYMRRLVDRATQLNGDELVNRIRELVCPGPEIVKTPDVGFSEERQKLMKDFKLK